MFSYYGSKSLLAKHYPTPTHDKIIEPFAGAARYSLLHWEKEVTIVDAYDVVIRIWKWLQTCSPADIYSLPELKKGEFIRDFNISDEEKLFLGMMAGIASTSPRNKVSAFSAECNGRKNRFKRIVEHLPKIKHWNIILGDYREIENTKATWFIDPPYQFGGQGYKHKKIDYASLSEWCESREGQVIVCENSKATWLPFEPLTEFRGAMSSYVESMYLIENNYSPCG